MLQNMKYFPGNYKTYRGTVFGVVLSRIEGYQIQSRILWIAAPTRAQAETLGHLQKQDGETIQVIYEPSEIQPLSPPEIPFKAGDFIEVTMPWFGGKWERTACIKKIQREFVTWIEPAKGVASGVSSEVTAPVNELLLHTSASWKFITAVEFEQKVKQAQRDKST